MKNIQLFKNQIELQRLLLKKAFAALVQRKWWAFVKFIQFVLYPMDFVRIHEFPFVISSISAINKQRINNLRIIDMSSPKIISFLIKDKFKPRSLHLTSYNDKVSEAQVSLYNSVSKDSLLLSEDDATCLSKYYNKYDLLYSISVVEHIPEDGDIKAINEFSKVVVNGGHICITVPYGKESKEYYEAGCFAHRWYSLETVRRRLFHKHLKLCRAEIIEENYPGYYQKHRKMLLALQNVSSKWQAFILLYRYLLGYWIGYRGFSRRHDRLIPIEGVGCIHLLFKVDK